MKVVLAYLPMVLWAAGVLAIGALEVRSASLPSGTDKAAHFVMYGLGGALAAFGRRWSGRGPAWAALGFIILVATADELHQRTLATRHGDLWDWVADVAGALVFYGLARGFLGSKRRRGSG